MKPPFTGGGPELIGTATIGEKGQIVIPVDARKKLGLSPGDKLVVLTGPHGSELILMKPEQIEEIVTRVTTHMAGMAEALKDAGNGKTGAANGKHKAGKK